MLENPGIVLCTVILIMILILVVLKQKRKKATRKKVMGIVDEEFLEAIRMLDPNQPYLNLQNFFDNVKKRLLKVL